MIEKIHPRLSVGAQCGLLSISRSSFQYASQGETAMDIRIPFFNMTWCLGRNCPHLDGINEVELMSEALLRDRIR
jgi:hypothetical protein